MKASLAPGVRKSVLDLTFANLAFNKSDFLDLVNFDFLDLVEFAMVDRFLVLPQIQPSSVAAPAPPSSKAPPSISCFPA